MSALKRNQQKNINRLLESFPVVLILGVRQCGKSTLSKELRPDWKYFDLENSRDFDFIDSDIQFFLNENSSSIIIDEAQELPKLFRNLRGLIDKKPQQCNRFLLTGSSSPELIKLASDSLAGRIGIVELGTLKVNELNSKALSPFYEIFSNEITQEKTIQFLKSKKTSSKKTDFIQNILKGGYPAPTIKNDDLYFQDWMENYFQTYINRDIKKLFPKLDSIKYRRFISMLSELSGNIINKAQLGRSIDVNEVTVRDYLDIADKTYFWRQIPSYEKTKVSSVTKMPKGILRDSGLLNFLMQNSTREKLIRSPNYGQIFESFAIEETLKGMNSLAIGKWDYAYYRTKNGVEIDLILDGPFGTLPIEIKSGTSTNIQKLKSLKYFIESQKLPLGMVINNSDKIQMISENIIQVPIHFI